MAQKTIRQTAGRDALGDFAPKFAELNDDVLFGQVWSRTDRLGLRDRSLVTVTTLIGMGVTDSSLEYHLRAARDNGLTRTEIAEVLTHAGFYAGWPRAWAAFRLAREVWREPAAAGDDARAAFERTSLFPVGEPNEAFARYFVGRSYLAPLSSGPVGIHNVTFEPRCRNNWHIHHAARGGGQTLVCVAGRGWYQEWGKPARPLVPGDVVDIPAGVKHWHGAAADSWFSHLAVEIPGERTRNEWLEPVDDEAYGRLAGEEAAAEIRRAEGEHASGRIAPERGLETEPLRLTDAWDKTFPKSDRVDHCKVTFATRFGITLAADLYRPKKGGEKLPAIVVAGPFGAVKEQASGLYAQTMAERGYLTLAFDPSFTGESGGAPRYVASPDISTEDFSAAVDYLVTRGDVDAERIGIIGICGWGGFAINAAALDTRIRATAAVTMYDMSRVTASGYFDALDAEGRYELRRQLNARRSEDARSGAYARAGGVADPLPDDAPRFVRDYHDYYKTPRGYHERSLNSNDGWNTTSALSFLNAPILAYSGEIRSAVLVVHGERAHSRYFGEDAFRRLTGGNKELAIVPGASHVDLYDRTDVIPFDRIASFFATYLR